MKDHVSRLGWFVRLAVLAGILLLTARIGVPPWAVRDPSVSGRLTALVSCILPGPTADLPSTPAGASDTMRLECEDSTPYRPGTVWIAC